MKQEANKLDLDIDVPSHYPLSDLLGVVLTSTVYSEQTSDMSANTLLQKTLDELLGTLKQHQAELKKDPKYIIDIVKRTLAPHIDMQSTSRGVLGKHRHKASPEQRRQFEKEFRELLVNFYSLTLANYVNAHGIADDTFEFLPTDDTTAGNKTAVHKRVKQEHGHALKVIYYLHIVGDKWLVYDIAVDGVSIIAAYRSAFANELHSKGIDALIKTLSQHNRSLLDT